MVELTFYISPEDEARFRVILDKMAISDREFLYRAFTRYLGLEEKELLGNASP